MVRIISCHHFRGQRIGRCDEAVGVAVAGDTVIVALEHQINIYGKATTTGGSYPQISHAISPPAAEIHGQQRSSPPPPLPGPGAATPTTTAKLMQQAAAAAASNSSKTQPPSSSSPLTSPQLGTHELGTPFVFSKFTRRGSEPLIVPAAAAATATTKKNTNKEPVVIQPVDTSELGLSHSFPTIDLIHKISYNEKGKYILCLEKREAGSNNSYTTNVRSYFHWEKDHGTKPMRARIAGLVSPTGAEPEEDSLMMVEIPLTSPATAATSCNLTGHIACLSAESIINLFLFRAKEVSGRVRVIYYDFDRTYAIELPGFIPEQIYFVSNYLACMNSEKVHVFRVRKEEGRGSPQFTSCSVAAAATTTHTSEGIGKFIKTPKKYSNDSSNSDTEKVVFNPKDETIKVYLPFIVRANRKRKGNTTTNISEDFQDEIHSNHTKVIFSATNPGGISVEDMLRVGVSNNSNASNNHSSKFLELGLYPIQVKDNLGAVALMICTKNEGYLYHLPCKPNCSVVRVTSYPFTASLISFAFDSVFFHALTETGLESYTCRSLYYATKDQEGIKPFLSDCPLYEEPPTLVGIRPFVGVRKMACNNLVLCLLASSSTNSTNNKSNPPPDEERAWTIYTLDLPDINILVDDIIKSANLQEDRTSETYITLLCEGYIALKLFMDSHPGSETHSGIVSRHKEICKSLGLAYLRSSVSLPNPSSLVAAGSSSSSAAASDVHVTTASPSTISSSTAEDSSSVSEVVSTLSVDISDDLVDKGVTYLLMGRCGVQEIFSPENWNSIHESYNIPGFIRMIEVTFIKSNEYEINPDNQRLSPVVCPVLVEFLANSGKPTLVDLVIQAPFIRESNSRRLLNILQQYAEARQYPAKETLAVILTLVTIGGVDLSTRSQVKDLLHKTNLNDLSIFLRGDILLEARGQQTFLTDLAICIVSDEQHQYLIAQKLFQYLKSQDINLSIVMFAFSQAINVNADSTLQHCITKCLTRIVEKYISDKLDQIEDISHGGEFEEEEKRAIQLLVRTYLSNINFSSNIPPTTAVADEHHHPTNVESHEQSKTSPINKGLTTAPTTDVLKRCQVFGSVCSCVNYLLSIYSPGGLMTPQAQNLATAHYFMNEDSRENYIKLLSLLSDPVLSNMEGIKEIVLTYLYKNATQVKPGVNQTLYIILQILAEIPEKSINLVLTKQPTTVMLFARETFGKDPTKWQRLVTNLKHRVQNGDDSTNTDIFATILESLYLHLANSLTPHELEQVLDKETEESQKFHTISRRVELAKNYQAIIISVSSDYLKK